MVLLNYTAFKLLDSYVEILRMVFEIIIVTHIHRKVQVFLIFIELKIKITLRGIGNLFNPLPHHFSGYHFYFIIAN